MMIFWIKYHSIFSLLVIILCCANKIMIITIITTIKGTQWAEIQTIDKFSLTTKKTQGPIKRGSSQSYNFTSIQPFSFGNWILGCDKVGDIDDVWNFANYRYLMMQIYRCFKFTDFIICKFARKFIFTAFRYTPSSSSSSSSSSSLSLSLSLS